MLNIEKLVLEGTEVVRMQWEKVWERSGGCWAKAWGVWETVRRLERDGTSRPPY
jgi:hypothetical protein